MRGVALTGLVCCLAACRSDTPRYEPHHAPALPPPEGAIVRVTSESELRNALRDVQSKTTILIEAGHFRLPDALQLGGDGDASAVTDVALRGATGNRNDVVLEGRGVVVGNVQGLQIADLTFSDVEGPALHVRGEHGAERPHVYNVRFADVAGAALRATAALNRPDGGVDGGVVEYSVFEVLDVGATRDSASSVVVNKGSRWIIRYNEFRDIRAGRDARARLRPAVMMRGGSQGTQTYNNLFIDCERAIAYGMAQKDGPVDHEGGAIYNNFIVRRRGFRGGDAGIMLWGSPGTTVYHNTVILNGTYKRPIEYRFASTTGVDIRNNLTDGPIEARDGAQAIMAGNFVKATPAMFRNALAGDLRLLPTAEQVIDRGVQLLEPLRDWDGVRRPSGARPDVGAHEHRTSADPPRM